MKKIIFSVMLAFAGVAGANAQTCGTDLACANGTTISLSAAAEVSGSHTVCLGNSLCGSRGIRVKVTVNGRPVFNKGSWSYGDANPTFNANAGDIIEVTATPGSVDRNIICVWAGEITACIAGNY